MLTSDRHFYCSSHNIVFLCRVLCFLTGDSSSSDEMLASLNGCFFPFLFTTDLLTVDPATAENIFSKS